MSKAHKKTYLAPIILVLAVFAVLILGYPVAISLAGTALIGAAIGIFFGTFDPSFLSAAQLRQRECRVVLTPSSQSSAAADGLLAAAGAAAGVALVREPRSQRAALRRRLRASSRRRTRIQRLRCTGFLLALLGMKTPDISKICRLFCNHNVGCVSARRRQSTTINFARCN